MSSSQPGAEFVPFAQFAAIEHQLMATASERDGLARERDRLAHERDEYKARAEWLHQQLELAPKFWRATRSLLVEAQLALPLGPLTVPQARALREAPVAPE